MATHNVTSHPPRPTARHFGPFPVSYTTAAVLFAMAELSDLIKDWRTDVSSLTKIMDDFSAASTSDITGLPRAARPVDVENCRREVRRNVLLIPEFASGEHGIRFHMYPDRPTRAQPAV